MFLRSWTCDVPVDSVCWESSAAGPTTVKLGSDEKIYGQVPFIGEDEIAVVADAIKRAWEEPQE